MTDPFDALASPPRRRVLELLFEKEQTSGELVEVIHAQFGISQSAVSQHLAVLREAGLVSVRKDGNRRVYSLDATPLTAIDAWLDTFRPNWEHSLSALETEVARGKRKRRLEEAPPQNALRVETK